MEKKYIVIGNWKLNPQKIASARVLLSRIEHGMNFVNQQKSEVVICPPIIFLQALKPSAHRVKLGGQTVSHAEKGSFTGEVSAEQLSQLGVKYCIVGHSERRALGESDEQITEKLKNLLAKNITPVLCVGYGTKKNHDIGTIKRLILTQLKNSLDSLGSKSRHVIVAYEPVWAISKGLGTGKTASAEHAKEIVDYVKSKYRVSKVIYGGSVDAKNVQNFIEQEIDGVLVGGASLHDEQFVEIIKQYTS